MLAYQWSTWMVLRYLARNPCLLSISSMTFGSVRPSPIYNCVNVGFHFSHSASDIGRLILFGAMPKISKHQWTRLQNPERQIGSRLFLDVLAMVCGSASAFGYNGMMVRSTSGLRPEEISKVPLAPLVRGESKSFNCQLDSLCALRFPLCGYLHPRAPSVTFFQSEIKLGALLPATGCLPASCFLIPDSSIIYW
jgi:hypothetical protein